MKGPEEFCYRFPPLSVQPPVFSTDSLAMIFSTVLMWLLIAVGFVVALPAIWLLSRALWPESDGKRREAASRGLFVCFLLGLAPAVGGVVLVMVVAKLPKMGALAALIGGVLLAWGFLGAGGIAGLIGERLWAKAEAWRQTMRGGVVLVCCALLPVVGWVVLLPLMAIVGGGINILAFFVRAKQPAPLVAAPPPLAVAPPMNVDSAAA